jgi:hypothetical protein
MGSTRDAHEAAEVIKTSYSIAVRGAHEYNDKIIEFAQANTEVAFGFFENLSGMSRFRPSWNFRSNMRVSSSRH